MRRTLALAISTAAAVAVVAAPQGAAAWTGDAYADGFVQRSDGSGTTTGTVDADPDGNLDLTASSVGGTKFRVPALKLGKYTKAATVNAQSYVSDGIPDGNGGFTGVEAGHEYRVTVTYGDLDLESTKKGTGTVVSEIWAQASAGSDGAGHTLVAGGDRETVTQDGATQLVFDVRVTQDSPLGVQAGIQLQTSATGPGNEASASLSGAVTDVTVAEIG